MDQTVLDTGPGGHSVFTFNLIDGLKSGAADLNGDGITTSGELDQYIGPRVTAASNGSQTPEYGILAGDRGGDFAFVPEGATKSVANESIVSIRANTDSAYVFADGNRVGLLTTVSGGVLNVPFPPGQHTLHVEKDGYVTSEKSITVNAGENQSIDFTLEEAFSTLDIFSSVDSADVFVNGVKAGTTLDRELKIKKPRGKYTIEMRKDRYASMSREVSSSNSEIQKVSFDLVPTFSVLHIHSDPADASIYVNGKLAGSGNVSIEVDKGRVTLRIEREGYRTTEKQVKVSENQTDLSYSLEPKTASLILSSDPPGAQVYVDGVSQGSTPTVVEGLRFGKHNVSVQKANYRNDAFVIDVNSEQRLNKYVEMKLTYEAQARMIYERELSAKSGWAWMTGIFAVGAGGAAYYFDSKANKSYQDYSSAAVPEQMNNAWNDYKQKVKYRNYFFGAAAGFGILCIYNIFRGVSYDEIYDEVKKGNISISFYDADSFKGVGISFKF